MKIDKYRNQERILKAIAHRTRLLIIDELTKGERCVCDLVNIIKCDQSTVSKHLAILQNIGIVYSEKKGMKVFYRLRCMCINRYIECISKVVKKSLKFVWEIGNDIR